MKKKIAFLIGSLDLDGASTWQITLGKYLNQNNFDAKIFVFCYISDNERVQSRVKDLPVDVEILDSPRHKLHPGYYLKLYKAMKAYQPDIIVNANLHLSFLIRFISRALSAPNVTVYQNMFDSQKGFVKIQDILTRGIGDKFVGVSKAVDKTIETVAIKKREVIYNSGEVSSNNIDKNKYKKKLNIAETDRIYLNIARYHPQKNQLNLIKGFSKFGKEFPGNKLILTGWGDLESQFRDCIKEHDAKDIIHLTGAVNDVHNLFSIADYFLLPSNHEGLPLALVEAISFGLPLIVTNLAELEDIAKDNALIIEGFSGENIYQGLVNSLDISDEKHKEMSKASLDIFEDCFHPQKMAKQYEELFNQMT